MNVCIIIQPKIIHWLLRQLSGDLCGKLIQFRIRNTCEHASFRIHLCEMIKTSQKQSTKYTYTLACARARAHTHAHAITHTTQTHYHTRTHTNKHNTNTQPHRFHTIITKTHKHKDTQAFHDLIIKKNERSTRLHTAAAAIIFVRKDLKQMHLDTYIFLYLRTSFSWFRKRKTYVFH